MMSGLLLEQLGRAFQSRPKPRGSSTSRASRSTSQTPARSSAVREFGQGLGQLVAPGLVFGLEGAELADGVGPPLRPRPAVLRAHDGADGLAGVAALAPAALALGVGHTHGGNSTSLHNGAHNGNS